MNHFVLSIALSILYISALAQTNQEQDTIPLKFYREADLFDEQKRVDPALGYVPKERLMAAKKYTFERMQLKDNSIAKTEVINNYKWIEMGPRWTDIKPYNNINASTGRIRTMLIHPTNKKEAWVGGIDGGLWYTKDISGNSPYWQKVNESFENMAISAICFNSANLNQMFFGVGEGYGNSDAVQGELSHIGAWISNDKGKTWVFINNPINTPALGNRFAIYKLKVSNGYILAATSGGLFRLQIAQINVGGNPAWTPVLGFGVGGGSQYEASDLEIAANGDIYASLGLNAAVFGTDPTVYGELFKSTNGGANWVQLTNNLPTSATLSTRWEIACAPSNSAIVYVLIPTYNVLAGVVTSYSFDVYKSTNSGTTFSTVTSAPNGFINCENDTVGEFTNGQAWYDLCFEVSPTNPNILWTGGLELHRSTDGAISWNRLTDNVADYSTTGLCKPYVHADQHNIVFEPGSNSVVYFCNDGGIYKTINGTAVSPSFTFSGRDMRIAQFNSVALRNNPVIGFEYFSILGGTQDNGTQKLYNSGLHKSRLTRRGDGGLCFFDFNTVAQNSNRQIISYTNNNLFISTDNGITFFPTDDNDNTGNFVATMDYDDNNDRLYSGGNNNVFYRWTGLFVAPIGGVVQTARTAITLPVALVPNNERISFVKLAPSAVGGANTLYIGTNTGKIIKVNNANTVTNGTITANSSSLTPIGNPNYPNGWISCIEVDNNNLSHLILTFSNYGVQSVWESTNGGTSWASLDNGALSLLPDMPINWAISAPTINNPNNISTILGTDVGIYANIIGNTGVWEPMNERFPLSRTDMLRYRPTDGALVAATHGRGVFRTDMFSNLKIDFTCNNCAANPCEGSSLQLQSNNTGLVGPIVKHLWDFQNDLVYDKTGAALTLVDELCYGVQIRYCVVRNTGDTLCVVRDINDIVTFNPLCHAIPGCVPIARLANVNEKVTVYPNPFTHQTQFKFLEGQEGLCKWKIFDANGSTIFSAENELYLGEQTLLWSPTKNISNGMYFYSIEINGEIFVGKVVKLE